MQVSNCGVDYPIDAVKNLPVIQPDPSVATYATLLGPRALHLRISAKCDSDCVYCERESWKRGDKAPEKDMPIEIWHAVKEKFLDRVEGIEVSGLGEPMLAKTFPEIARDVLAAGKIFYFPTNGHFLTTKVADCLGDGTNVRVSISFDAADPKTYVEIGRGKKEADFRKTVNGVKAFRKARPKAFLHSQFTAGQYNIDEFPAFVDLAAEMGIQEIQFRFVQAHTIAREDVSLRFAKDRTEAAIASAADKARRHGIELRVERRKYSEELPNATRSTIDPSALAGHYLDFAAFSDPTCDGTGSSTSTMSCHLTAVTILGSTVTSSTILGVTFISSFSGSGVVPNCGVTASGAYNLTSMVLYQGNLAQIWLCPDGHRHTCYTGLATTLVITQQTETLVYAGVSCTSTNGVVTVGQATTVLGQSISQTFGDCPPYVSIFGIGEAEVVSTVTVPRSELSRPEFAAMSISQPFKYADAAAIVWCDGSITSCFAQHIVGHVATDDYDSLIANPRYQAFLQKRQSGVILAETWCANCPRVF